MTIASNKTLRVAPRLSPGLPDPKTSRAVRAVEDTAAQHETRVTSLESRVGKAGGLLGVQVLTGAGTYKPTSGTTRAVVKMVGGGGGGAGASSGAGAANAGAGGNSGWLLELLLAVTGARTFTGGVFSCGAAGTGGNPGNPGGTGGDTTIVINGVTYTAKGGTGGTSAGGASAGGGPDGGPGTPATQPTPAGTLRTTMNYGGISFVFAALVGLGGQGGSIDTGTGGAPLPGFATVNANGNPGLGFGSGGGGATTVGAHAQTGGAGTAGTIIIEEYA